VNSRLKLAAAVALGSAAVYAACSWGRRKPGAHDRERIGYPPFDTLKEVSENIWVVDSGPMKPAGLSLPIRMTVIRLSGGELWLHSPTQFTPSLAEELGRLGPVRYLVAPSIAHWTFTPDWQQAFPDAQVWAVPALGKRPQVRRADLRIDHELGGNAPQAWRADIAQGIIQGGGGFEEAHFLHRPSRTLLLADLIQNLEPDKLPPVTSALASAARASAGRTPLHVRAAIVLGDLKTKNQVTDLVATNPARVIFAHGRWFESNAAARLKQAFDWLL
jgi:hypothetical protein